MVLEKKPFRKYNEKENKDSKNIISVRVSDKEKEILEEMKEILDIDSNSKALKFFAIIGKNVVFSIFGKDMLKFLYKEDRLRYIGMNKFIKNN